MNRYHLLLVDDDPDIRVITEVSFAAHRDFAVTSCSSGFQALKLLRMPGSHFDVILLDMTLIDSTGLEIIAGIRADLATSTAVIFFTANARPAAIDAYLQAGAAGVIAKPFAPLTLPDQVRDIVTSRNGKP